MLTLLIVIGVVAVFFSAGITVVACMAAARQTAHENWSEQPLVMREAERPVSQPKRVTS